MPPDTGPYAVYNKDAVWSRLNYAIKSYSNIQATSVGVFGYQLSREEGLKNVSSKKMSPIDVCFNRYVNATLNPSFGEYFIDYSEEQICVTIDNLHPPSDEKWNNFSIVDYLKEHNHDEQIDNFNSLISISLKLPLRTIVLNEKIASSTPECFDLDVNIHFNNRQHSGEIRVQLHASYHQFNCFGKFNIFEVIFFFLTVLFVCRQS